MGHPPSIDRSRFADAASAIEAAALRPERWQEVVDRLREALPGSRTVLHAMDRQGGLPVPMTVSGWPPDCIRDYIDHYRSINPWAPVLLGCHANTVLSTEEMLPATAFRHTAFYTDWLAPIGGADAASGLKVLDSDGRSGLVLIHYDARHAVESHARAAEALEILGPAMRRALDVQLHAGTLRAGEADVPLLGRIVEPAFLVDANMRLHAANPAGEALTAPGGTLRVGCGDRLSATDPLPDMLLAAAVRAALLGSTEIGPVPRVLPLGRAAYDLSVVPVTPEMRPLSGIGPIILPRTLALVVLRPRMSGLGDPETAMLLRQRYRLTVAEARIALMLDGRLNLVDVADRLGISYETARTHARSIYAKSDLRGQAALARLVADTRSGM